MKGIGFSSYISVPCFSCKTHVLENCCTTEHSKKTIFTSVVKQESQENTKVDNYMIEKIS